MLTCMSLHMFGSWISSLPSREHLRFPYNLCYKKNPRFLGHEALLSSFEEVILQDSIYSCLLATLASTSLSLGKTPINRPAQKPHFEGVPKVEGLSSSQNVIVRQQWSVNATKVRCRDKNWSSLAKSRPTEQWVLDWKLKSNLTRSRSTIQASGDKWRHVYLLRLDMHKDSQPRGRWYSPWLLIASANIPWHLKFQKNWGRALRTL